MLRSALVLTTALTAATLLATPPAPSLAGEPTSARVASTSLTIGEGRRVAVKIRCSTSKPCKGVIRLRVGNGTDRHRKNYVVAGRKTATIQVGITPTAKRKVMDGQRTAEVTLTEPDGGVLEKTLPIRLAT